MKVQLTMTESQARTVMDALDFYSRVGHGQLVEIKHVMERSFGKEWGKDKEVDGHIEAIKSVYFPELDRGSYHGIFSTETPEECKSSWDLIQVIRYAIAWHNNPGGGNTVDFGTPTKSSGKEELASVEIKRGE